MNTIDIRFSSCKCVFNAIYIFLMFIVLVYDRHIITAQNCIQQKRKQNLIHAILSMLLWK